MQFNLKGLHIQIYSFMTSLPLTARWIPVLTQTASAHLPKQKYSPVSLSFTSRISRATGPLSSAPMLLMRRSAVWTLTVSSPNLPNITVSRGSSWSERRRYQVMSVTDVRLQVSEMFCPAWTTRADRRTGEADVRWPPATPAESEESRWSTEASHAATSSFRNLMSRHLAFWS